MNRSGLWMLVLLTTISVRADNPNNKCLSLEDNQDVDFWTVLTVPGSTDFFYADSRHLAASLKTDSSLEEFFTEHTKVTYWNELQEMDPGHKVQFRDGELADDDLPNVWDRDDAVIQVWFNDQPYGLTKSSLDDVGKKQSVIPIGKHILLKNKIDSQATKRTYDFKPAHAKGMISMKGSDKSGFYINHSFPKLPVDLLGNPNSIFQGKPNEAPYIFRWAKDSYNYFKKDTSKAGTLAGNTLKYSQHAFCFNIGKEEAENLLDLFDFTHYQAVNWNMHPRYWGKTKDPNEDSQAEVLRKTLGGQHWDQMTGGIVDEWLKRTNTAAHPLRPSQEPTAQQILAYPINSQFPSWVRPIDVKLGNFKMKVIGHASFPVKYTYPRQKGEESKLVNHRTEYPFIGPVPWLQVSKILKTDLLVSSWLEPNKQNGKKKDNKRNPENSGLTGLPAVCIDNAKVFPVSKVIYTDSEEKSRKTWAHHNMHEKIGVSTDAKLPFVCFGDANHRASEQTHAGITFCLENLAIWEFFHQAAKEIEELPSTGQAKPTGVEEKKSANFKPQTTLKLEYFPYTRQRTEFAHQHTVNDHKTRNAAKRERTASVIDEPQPPAKIPRNEFVKIEETLENEDEDETKENKSAEDE